MHELAPLIYDLAVISGLAGVVALICQRIRQPVVLGYLIAGMIVGPYTPPHAFVKDIANIHILSELGVIFLMFSLGLEFSFRKLTRVGFSASVTGFIEVIFMIFLGYGAGALMGWSHYDSIFLGAALSISSTTIIIKAIDELGLKSKRFSDLIFGVLIVEDLLAVLLLVGLSTIVVTDNIISMDIVYAAIRLVLVVGGWFLIGYFLVPPAFRKIAHYINQETLTMISVGLCLFLVCVAANFHYSTALGAFIMGSILAETVLVHRIEHIIRPIRDIFAAVFFVSVGMLIDPVIILQNWQVVAFLSLVTIVGKVVTTGTGSFLTGQSLPTSVRVGFGMAQVGEFSFIIVSLGLTLHATTDKLYALIVAVSGITTFTTPYLIRFSGVLVNNLDRKLPERLKIILLAYSSWVYRSRSTTERTSLYNSVALRLFVNGIVVALIFIGLHYLMFSKYVVFSKRSGLGNGTILIISLLCASPFIWGMLFSLQKNKLAQGLKTFHPVSYLIWFITFTEVAFLSLLYFHTWAMILTVASLSIIFFYTCYRHLEKYYDWFEGQLMGNLFKPSTTDVKLAELAPWDSHLIEIEVGELSIFAGKSLTECRIRQDYGVNIVAICNGSRVLTAPRGNDHIIPHDKLIVLGNDAQLEAFRNVIEMKGPALQENFLGNFALKTILITTDHPLLGFTIRNSNIRETVNGLVVGLERDQLQMLNPDPDTILKAHDLILIVGELEKLKGIK